MHKILSYLLLTTRNIIFHFFLSIQFTILPIVTVTFLTWLSSVTILTLYFLLLNTMEALFSPVSLICGVSLSGCFVKNWKCEKLFIKIIFSVPTSFSSTDTHTQYHALYLQLSSQKINLQKSAVSLHKDIKLFAFFSPGKIKSKQERWAREKSLLQNFNSFPCWAEEKGFQKSFWKIKDLNNQTKLLMSHCFSLFKPKAWPLVIHIPSNWLNSKLLNVLEMFV